MYLGAGGIEYFECTISNQKADILFNFDIFFLKQKIYRNQKKNKNSQINSRNNSTPATDEHC